jgi:hypothetical protein
LAEGAYYEVLAELDVLDILNRDEGNVGVEYVDVTLLVGLTADAGWHEVGFEGLGAGLGVLANDIEERVVRSEVDVQLDAVL